MSKSNTRRHNLERPIRMGARAKKKSKKRGTNGAHPADRGHGSQGHTRETAPTRDPMEQAPSNRPFRDLASAALSARGGNGQVGRLSPLEAAKARRARAEQTGTLPGGIPASKPKQPESGYLSADEKLLLAEHTAALRENTDTLREVNGMEPIDRSEEAAEFIPPDLDEPGDEDADDPGDEDSGDPGDEDSGDPGDEDSDEPGDEDSDEPGDEDSDEPGDDEDEGGDAA